VRVPVELVQRLHLPAIPAAFPVHGTMLFHVATWFGGCGT
jgi:hypothetical protein